MIHVQIATDITTAGVEGVRWVLLETNDADAPTGAVAAPAAEPVPSTLTAAAAPASSGRRAEIWQLAITCLGLLVALGLSQHQLGWPELGWPELPWRAAPATAAPSAPPAALPSSHATPAAAEAAAPMPGESAWVIILPATSGARQLADASASDSAAPSQAEPAASTALPERPVTVEQR